MPRLSVADASAAWSCPFEATTTTVSPAATPAAPIVSASVFDASSVTERVATVPTKPAADGGGAAATAAVGADVAVADPAVFVAVTAICIVALTSASVSAYVDAVPTCAHGEPPEQRCQS